TVNARVNALAIMPNPVFVINLKRIADFALAERLPSMFHLREFAAVGRADELWRRSQRFVPPRSKLRGQDTQGCPPGRPADRAADQIRAGGELTDSQEARSHRSSVVAGDGRRGDRVVSRVFMPKAGITSLFRYFEDTEFP